MAAYKVVISLINIVSHIDIGFYSQNPALYYIFLYLGVAQKVAETNLQTFPSALVENTSNFSIAATPDWNCSLSISINNFCSDKTNGYH